MIDTRAVMRSLPLVASVLGQKYGVKVEIGGNDAYTDGKTIHLPALPADVPDTFLALARGFLDHEAGHVRDTDFQALGQAHLSPLEMHVWNTIEDWRVENKLAEVFPGCRGNFNWLIRHVFGSEQPPSSAHPAAAILNWLLLHVRTWDVPELRVNRDSLAHKVDTQFPGVRAQIESVLQTVRGSCHSTQDAIDSARQIVRILEQASKPEHSDTPDAKSASQKEPEGQNGEGNESPSEDPSGESQLSKASHEEPDNEDARSEQSTSSALTDMAKQEITSLLEAKETDLPATLGSVLAATLEDASQQSASSGSVAVAVQTTKQGKPLSDQDIGEATRASVALRTRLHGLLQTTIQTRNAPGRKGRLDTRSLHRLAVSDPRVFRKNTHRQGIDTAVHVLLDCSGSMVRNIHLACTACYAVGKALEAIGINVAVTAFPADQLPDGSYITIAPIIRHGQRVHARLDLSPAGGTPMGEALWWTMQDMLTLAENRKIILIVTDGSPDSQVCAEHAIAAAKATGFEVYGIGIGSDCIVSLLPQSRTIQNLSELSPSMFAVLQNALIP